MKNKQKILVLLICFVAMFSNFRANAQIEITVCADAPNFTLSFDPQILPPHMLEGNGQPAEFFINFGEPISITPPPTLINLTTLSGTVNASREIVVNIPSKIYPNHYNNAKVYLKNTINNCEFNLTSLKLKILYPSTIFEQKWNDVVALLNDAHNGGYGIELPNTTYQWYHNGVIMQGENKAYIYVPYTNVYINTQCITYDEKCNPYLNTSGNKLFKNGDKFSVMITRGSDNTKVMSCSFVINLVKNQQGIPFCNGSRCIPTFVK